MRELIICSYPFNNDSEKEVLEKISLGSPIFEFLQLFLSSF